MLNWNYFNGGSNPIWFMNPLDMFDHYIWLRCVLNKEYLNSQILWNCDKNYRKFVQVISQWELKNSFRNYFTPMCLLTLQLAPPSKKSSLLLVHWTTALYTMLDILIDFLSLQRKFLKLYSSFSLICSQGKFNEGRCS